MDLQSACPESGRSATTRKSTAMMPRTMTSGSSKMLLSVETWKSIFDTGAVVLVFITGAFAAGGLITGNRINRKQAEKILQLETVASEARAAQQAIELDLSKQQELTAEAQKELLELQNATLPRNFDPSILAKKLAHFSGTPVAFFSLADLEPSMATGLITRAVSEAGWDIAPRPASVGGGEIPPQLATAGIFIEVNPKNPEDQHEVARLSRAADALVEALQGVHVEAKRRPLTTPLLPAFLPAGTVDVLVSLKPYPWMPNDVRFIGWPTTNSFGQR